MPSPRFCALPLALVFAGLGSLHAADVPGGVTDPTGRTGFLATRDGGIDAVNLATGEVLWQSTEAQRPLFVREERLYALAAVRKKRPLRFMGFNLWKPPPGQHGFRIVGFDLKDELRLVFESEVVELPEWVRLPNSAGQAFTTRWQLEKDALVLTWEARAWYTGSKRPTPPVEAVAPQHAAGAMRLDLETGATAAASPEEPRLQPGWPFAQDLEKLAVRWEGLRGASYKALLLEESDGKQKLVLRSWDAATHAPQQAKELATGKQFAVLATTDGNFLCLRETLPSPDKVLTDAERTNYGWRIFAVESGERVATLPFDPRTQTMTVLDERAYLLIGGPILGTSDRPFLHTRSVRAVDLKSGKTLWERPIPGKPLVLPPG